MDTVESSDECSEEKGLRESLAELTRLREGQGDDTRHGIMAGIVVLSRSNRLGYYSKLHPLNHPVGV